MSDSRVDLATCDEEDFPKGGTNCKFDFEVEDDSWMDHSA